MFTKRNLFKSTKIALAFAAAVGGITSAAAFNGPLSSDAYGAGEIADIRAGVTSASPSVALQNGPVISPLASDSDTFGAGERAHIAAEAMSAGPAVALQNGSVISPLASDTDAFGAGERADIAAAANESFSVASSGPVDYVVAEEEVAEAMVGEIDDSPAASNADESATEDGALSSDAYGADETSA